MAELGDRVNVMGPQPIAGRTPVPPAMIAAAERVLALLAAGDATGLAAMAAPSGVNDLAELAAAATDAGARGGAPERCEIIAAARVNYHYYVKGRIHRARAEPFTMQFRLGEDDGRWTIREVQNLSGRRSAWTR
ncbi:MAG: hypothetical protein IVW56_12640 [Candidatus Binataceae bacterium]|nr:hypothetical protein [Candidatus Binataceae bacterium]